MSIITTSQVTAFREQARRNFATRLTVHFQSRHTGQVSHAGEAIPEGPELAKVIWQLMTVASDLQIITERAVGQFVATGLGYSRKFYMLERVQAILRDPKFSPDQNMQRVVNAIIVAEARSF